MFRLIYVLLGLVFCANSMRAQQSSLDELLQTIETHNAKLAAFRSHMKSQSWQYKRENKLPNPQASAFYLPFGEHNTGDYSEYQISQEFEFPSVYASRGSWVDEQEKRLEREYEKLKQEILLDAQKLGLELVYINKQRALAEERVAQSRKVYEQVETLFEKGETGILERNKARIVWLDQQFALEELNTHEMSIMQDLQAMNGGNEIDFKVSSYPKSIKIPGQDSLWNERLGEDAQIALLEQEKQVAQQRLKLERNQLLPNITAGFNYQGVAGNNYSGFYGGFSIPLWSGRSQIKIAEAQINYYTQHKSDVIASLKSNFNSQVKRYQLLSRKFKEYRKAMKGLNSEMLLQKSYKLGEISFMSYYGEVSFYRQAENRMLEIEKELYQLRAELFKYKL